MVILHFRPFSLKKSCPLLPYPSNLYYVLTTIRKLSRVTVWSHSFSPFTEWILELISLFICYTLLVNPITSKPKGRSFSVLTFWKLSVLLFLGTVFQTLSPLSIPTRLLLGYLLLHRNTLIASIPFPWTYKAICLLMNCSHYSHVLREVTLVAKTSTSNDAP